MLGITPSQPFVRVKGRTDKEQSGRALSIKVGNDIEHPLVESERCHKDERTVKSS